MIAAIKSFFHVTLYQPLYNILIFLAWLVPGHSIGWAIIALTIIIRLILMPSSIKAARAQVKLQALQPKMNEIRKKYTDQAEQSKALMELYKQEGASPFGSCLPQLIQLPLILVLYRVFRNGLDVARFSLLYPFTPHPSTINSSFYGLDLAKPELWVLPLIAGLTQLVLSLMMQPKTPKAENSEGDPTQMMMKQMVVIFPVMTFFVGRTLPAALSIYWIATTLFGIGQQWYVNKQIKKPGMDDPTSLSELRGAGRPRDNRQQSVPVVSSGNRVEGKKGNAQQADAPKKDFLTRMNEKRMEKSERQGDVTVSIRKKEKK